MWVIQRKQTSTPIHAYGALSTSKKLNYQIKSGITEILLDHIFYGSVNQSGTDGWSRNRFNPGLSESIMNLPIWFKNGLIDYLSKDWDTDLDNYLKDLILSKNQKV